MRHLVLGTALVVLAISWPLRAHAQGPTTDTLSLIQSTSAFSSVQDGHPNVPAGLELKLAIAWTKNPSPPHPLDTEPSLEYTPRGGYLARNLLVGLGVPYSVDRRGLHLGDLSIFWQQRWIASVKHLFTGATFVQADFPTSSGKAGTDFTLWGIAVKSVRRNSFYLNVFGTTNTSIGFVEWGGVIGYRYYFSRRRGFVLDYVYTEPDGESGRSELEISADYTITSDLILGPGILIGLSSHPTAPSFGIGILITYAF